MLMEKNLPKLKKILFFSPHPDDDVIFAGAFLYTLSHNNEIISVYVTNSPRGVSLNLSLKEKIQIRQEEARKACQVINVTPLFLNLDQPILEVNENNVKKIKELLFKEKPSVIFIPPENDVHSTHQKVTVLVNKALKFYKVKNIYYYDSWSPLTNPNFIFTFNKKLLKIKSLAIKKHQSQLDRLNYLRAAIGLNTFRGETAKELMGGFGKKSSQALQYGEGYLIK